MIVLFLVGDAYGGMTAEKWITTYKNPDIGEKTREVLMVYLAGVADGIEIMDVILEAKGHNITFFCVPDNLALTTDQRINMLEAVFDKERFKPTDPLTLAIFDSYIYAFPCTDKTN